MQFTYNQNAPVYGVEDLNRCTPGQLVQPISAQKISVGKAMTTTQLRPDGTYLNQWSVIEHTSAHEGAVRQRRQQQRARHVRPRPVPGRLQLGRPVPPGAVVRSITPIARVSTDASPGAYIFQYQMTIANVPTVGIERYTSPTITNVYNGQTSPVTNLTLTGLTGNYSQSDIDNLGFSASAGIITGTSPPVIHELFLRNVPVRRAAEPSWPPDRRAR